MSKTALNHFGVPVWLCFVHYSFLLFWGSPPHPRREALPLNHAVGQHLAKYGQECGGILFLVVVGVFLNSTQVIRPTPVLLQYSSRISKFRFTRNAMLARHMLSSCVRPSVRLSVRRKPVLYRNEWTNRAGFWQVDLIPPPTLLTNKEI